ncbi:TPA_asm: RNA-directed RNA polymerase [ssRNA phage SRR5467090_2]|uniref:RNA-directed RNA polymerase n=1 Tax=ssRNA phage SRR5467090_2 TaxID=2786451 RepID=A0A8S5L0C5_9VIRU|nr:RNA-directed RNA polymerase [ssRNA phage SRR5467090_2]DAD50891.1 TPA_asm: RNA-directed RNA polymerase [ssRNA phage SRR5467090_2]
MTVPRTVDVSVPDHISRKFENSFRHMLNSFATGKNVYFKDKYLLDEVFSKYLDESIVPADVRRDAAVNKFTQVNDRNAAVNLHLVMMELTERDLGWTDASRLIKVARRLIARVLGPLKYPGVLMKSTFTNGASTRVRRGPAAACVKFTGEVHITDPAIKHWLAMASGSRLSRLPLRIVQSSVLFTVPKKTEIDRVACKEPEGNALLQRSVGIAIRQRLRKVGINLLDQTRNQDLAKRAVNEGLATIDLSSASDTVSTRVVEMLLPFDWWSLLSDLRVESTVLPDNRVLSLDLFSSMGNGFTFELESLIFWALATAVKRIGGYRGEISVFGDDIIVPQTMARRFMRVLSLFGFVPNKKKTHVSGPFFESCGRHYWCGLDITPFYFRKAVTTLPEMINILNRLLEWDGREWGFFATDEARQFWNRWKTYIPKYLWGGISPDDPSCLVTGDAPRKRLVPVLKKVKVAEKARLDTWLHRSDTRLEPPQEPVVVDPADVIGYEAVDVVAAGERTTWSPNMVFEDYVGGERL